MPWPTPMHIVQSAYRPPVRRAGGQPWSRAARRSRRAGGRARSHRRSDSHARASSAIPSIAQHRERLRGKRLVELDDVHAARCRRPSRFEQLARRRHWTDAHDARRHACDRAARDPRERLERYRLRGALARDQQRAAPSLTPEALPAVTVPPGRNGVLSFASSSRLVSRGCSSARTTSGSPFPRATSRARSPPPVRRAPAPRRALLAAQREGILVGARIPRSRRPRSRRSPASSRRRTAP